jgi:hypothetical protein
LTLLLSPSCRFILVGDRVRFDNVGHFHGWRSWSSNFMGFDSGRPQGLATVSLSPSK